MNHFNRATSVRFSSARLFSLVCGVFFFLLFSVLPLPSEADDLVEGQILKWGYVPDFVFNSESFQALEGLNLSTEQFTYWIAYAFANWRTRTGVNFQVDYESETTDTPVFDWQNKTLDWHDDDLEGIVLVIERPPYPDCHQLCDAYAYADREFAYDWMDDTFYLQECGLLVFSNTGHVWRVDSKDFHATQHTDLVSVLIHEVGHCYGLHHHLSHGAVMFPQQLYGTLGRFPVKNDIDKMRLRYNRRNLKVSWRDYDWGSDQWSSSSHLISGYTNRRPSAAVGALNNDPYYRTVVAVLGTDNIIYYWKKDGPPESAAPWGAPYWFGASYRSFSPPSVAATTVPYYYPRMVMVWANQAENVNDCPGISVYASDTVGYGGGILNDSIFYAGGGTMFEDDCTVHGPAVAFHPESGRFVLAYVKRSDERDEHNYLVDNDHIMVTTSHNGIHWTAPQDLGLFALDSPGLECPVSGDCILTYVRAGDGDDPYLGIQALDVDPVWGTVTKGTGTIWWYRVQQTPPALAMRPAGQPDTLWWVGMHYSFNVSQWIDGTGGLFTIYDDAVPPWSGYWKWVRAYSDHSFDLATSHGLTTQYAFWVHE